MTDEHVEVPGEEPFTEGSVPGPDGRPTDSSEPTDRSDMVEEGSPIDAVTDVDGGGAGDELALARVELAERTLDLQRLQAEYLNYKRRVERDRELIRENATYSALAPITEVLDTIDRAREAAAKGGGDGELDGGLKAVAEQLERVVAGLGLIKFGTAGDAFDPTVHDALSHLGEDAEVSVPTVKVVAKAGYRIGERVVRAAQVLVVDPTAG